jgi:hypothetical protein
VSYLIVGAIVFVMLIGLRIHIRRDERWPAEQARLDEEARRARAEYLRQRDASR